MLAKVFLQNGKEEWILIRFLNFLKNFIFIENREINQKYDQEVESITGKRNPMGINETLQWIAREEERELSRFEFVKNMLAANKFSDKEIAHYAGTDEAFVLKIKEQLKL